MGRRDDLALDRDRCSWHEWALSTDGAHGPAGQMGNEHEWASGMDGTWAWMDPHSPGGYMRYGNGWILGMEGLPWALGMDGPWALGMDGS